MFRYVARELLSEKVSIHSDEEGKPAQPMTETHAAAVKTLNSPNSKDQDELRAETPQSVKSELSESTAQHSCISCVPNSSCVSNSSSAPVGGRVPVSGSTAVSQSGRVPCVPVSGCVPVISSVPSCQSRANDVVAVDNAYSLFARFRSKLSANLEHYNSILHGFLALPPILRCGQQRRSRSLNREKIDRKDNESSIVDSIELSHMTGILRVGSRGAFPGHKFVSILMDTPAWCDKCGRFMLGLYRHCLRCTYCHYTCHVACRHLITLECPIMYRDKTYDHRQRQLCETSITGCPAVSVVTNYQDLSHTAVEYSSSSLTDELELRIKAFNHNTHGLVMTLKDEAFQGSIRVHLNLYRPITMCTSAVPPSIFDVIPTQNEPESENFTYNTSFYLPRDTSKVIHIVDNTTTAQVIQLLLKKFCITDNPKKFALYHKSTIHDNKHTMRKLGENELPLVLCLHWCYQGLDALNRNRFILQENDSGEISWEIFSIPELENFLAILRKEEEEHIDQLRSKYSLLRLHMCRRMRELDRRNSGMEKRNVLDCL